MAGCKRGDGGYIDGEGVMGGSKKRRVRGTLELRRGGLDLDGGM